MLRVISAPVQRQKRVSDSEIGLAMLLQGTHNHGKTPGITGNYGRISQYRQQVFNISYREAQPVVSF